MIEQITERIFKNWKTSLVAVVIFGALGASVFLEYATFREATGWFAAAFTFMLSKDGSISKKK